MPHASAYRPSRILFGAAYYAEYHREQRTDTDLDLMADAGFTVIRVGESVWSTWEPRDGEFDIEWLAPVLDGAHERGISVILGTPTYAVPPWLAEAYPEIAGEDATGHRLPWGHRQEVDYTHPAFRFHAERVIRRILERYADHPAVIGFQVDNEPGLHLFHNEGVFRRFVRRLQAEFGDVETLNREWGLTYWSHRISDWSQLWRPDGNSVPQYDLAWRRYQADLTTEFIAWQAKMVREYARDGQFVTTCIAYPRPALDDEKLTKALDVTSGNPYYAMQDTLDARTDGDPLTPWTTGTTAGLLRQADRIFSSKQARFLVTETNAQSIGGPEFNSTPYPGQLAQSAFAFISRGAAMIEYWHWHTLPYGYETYWGGVLPHSLVPGRVYDELAEVGARLREIGDGLDGYEPDADVAVLWSNASRYALAFQPPLRTAAGGGDPQSYERIFDAYYRGVVDAGAQARILHADQALHLGARALAERHPVLVAPGFYVATDDELALLRDYAAAGGHLVVGIRTGYADDKARARLEVAPPGLREAAGVSYEEFSGLPGDLTLEVGAEAAASGFAPGPDATARLWADGLRPEGADVLARYRHSRFGDFAAVTTHEWGEGRVSVVGTMPSPELAAEIVRFAVPSPIADALAPDRALPVAVTSGMLPDGRRAWFVFNWSPEHGTVRIDRTVRTWSGDAVHPRGTQLALSPWAVLALVDE